MGEFIIDAEEMNRRTPNGRFRHEEKLESLFHELLSMKITWKEFIHECSSLAEDLTESFIIGSYIGIIGSSDEVAEILNTK